MTVSRKKRYTVTGPSKVHGHEPGATFAARLDPEHELRLLQGGHLTVAVGDDSPSKPAGATKPRKRGEANETTDGGAS